MHTIVLRVIRTAVLHPVFGGNRKENNVPAKVMIC